MTPIARFRLWRYRRALRTIRQEAERVGLYVRDLTDDELEAAVIRIVRATSTVGVTTDEAVRAARAFQLLTPRGGPHAWD